MQEQLEAVKGIASSFLKELELASFNVNRREDKRYRGKRSLES